MRKYENKNILNSSEIQRLKDVIQNQAEMLQQQKSQFSKSQKELKSEQRIVQEL